MIAVSHLVQPIPGLIVRGSQGFFSLCEVYFNLHFLSYFTGLKENEGIYQ